MHTDASFAVPRQWYSNTSCLSDTRTRPFERRAGVRSFLMNGTIGQSIGHRRALDWTQERNGAPRTASEGA